MHDKNGTQKTVTRSFTPTSTYQRFSFTIAGDTDASYGIIMIMVKV